MKVVALSDFHLLFRHITVPDGDLLLIAGDMTSKGRFQEIVAFNDWLAQQPHRHKVVVPGNHDFLYETEPALARELTKNCHLLIDQEVTIEGIKIWGSPYTPYFGGWAFNLFENELKTQWDQIPEGLDILVTHGPPYGYLDFAEYSQEHVGCKHLLSALDRAKPKYHVFGHIHEGHGAAMHNEVKLLNVSICNLDYRPVHNPIVFNV